jgi:ATP-binding cassette, subfamily B (MDR/TAP), member 9
MGARRGLGAALALIALADVGAALFFAARRWPAAAHGRTPPASAFDGWERADESADVALITILRVVVVATAVALASLSHGGRRRACSRPPTTATSRAASPDAPGRPGGTAAAAVAAACHASYALLSVKAMAIAVLTPDGAWPGGGGSGSAAAPSFTGLAPLFAALCTSAACGGLEHWAGARLVRGAAEDAEQRKQRARPGSAVEAPLLLDANGDGDGDDGLEDDSAAEDGGTPLPPPDTEAPPLPPSRTLAVLARIAAQDAPYLAAAFAAGAAAAVGNALIPHYTGVALDDATLRPDRAVFHATLARLAAAAAGTAVATATRGGLFWAVGVRLNVRTRTRLFASLLRQEAAFFDAARLGDLASRLSADTAAVSDNLSLQLNVLARSLIGGCVVLVFMVRASWRLSVLAALILPIIAAVSKAFGRVYRELAKQSQAALADANSAAEEVLATMPTVKAHAAEAASAASYGSGLAGYARIQAAEGRYYALYALASTGLPALLATGVLAVGGTLVLDGRMSGGALIAFLLYQTSLASTIQTLGDVFSAVAAAVGSADKVVELMERVPRLPPAGTAAPPTFEGSVEFRGVHFSYPARPSVPVLRGLDLAIRPGEVVALVGPSGSGKSSIVKLLLRLYAPSAGTVLLDGRPLGEFDPRWRARHVGCVGQEPTLYARSVRRNILLGLEEDGGDGGGDTAGWAADKEGGGGPHPRPRPAWLDPCPTQADVEAAARMAHAHDFITALPDGYDTLCGDRGVMLSGGQKQRIAIARALVRRPGLLLLDEATSALDAASEAAVQEAVDGLARARAFTMVIIAHRLSTVAGAHRVVVVDGGRVVEAGPPDDLLAAGGAYAALVRRQLQGGGSTASLRGGSAGGGGERPGGGGSGGGSPPRA